jgi:glutaredoxin
MNVVTVLLAIMAVIAYQIYVGSSYEKIPTYSQGDSNVIMYSLTTCGYCNKKREELHKNNISFTEYFIDKDNARQEELNQKLAKAGFQPRGYGTPIFDVYGVMLPNNPPLNKILKHINQNRDLYKDTNKSSNLDDYVESSKLPVGSLQPE